MTVAVRAETSKGVGPLAEDEALTFLATVLNSIDALVYISDIETHKILFINDYTHRITGDVVGQFCYDVLQQDRSTPCEFCTNDQLLDAEGQPTGTVVWEQWSAIDGRWYERRDVAIPWIGGRMARLEIAIDRTARHTAEERLRESEDRFRRLSDATSEAVIMHDEHRFVDFNANFQTLTGYSRKELLALGPRDVVAPDYHDRLEVCLLGEDATLFEVELIRKDGSHVPVEGRSHRFDDNGQTLCLGALRDLTRRRNQEAAIREREERLRAILDAAPDGIITIDEKGIIEICNHALEECFGYEAGELIGRKVNDLMPEPYNQRHDVYLQHYLRTGQGAIIGRGRELIAKRKDGSVFPVHISLSEARLGHERRFTAIIRDLTERNLLAEQIAHLANNDPLTGLPRRSLFIDRLDQAMARAERDGLMVVLLVVDLDHLTTVNATFGHAIGDEVLKETARRLQICVGEGSGASVGRLDADAFGVLLPQFTQLNEITQTVSGIQDALVQVVEMGDTCFEVTCSIGVAIFPRDGRAAEELLRAADVALGSVSTLKGERHLGFFDPSMNETISERMEMESALRDALNRGEFEAFFQPQIDLETRKLAGAEALLRWRHPEKGLIGPGRFIPILEENGQINEIGAWLLKDVCRQMKEWLAQGLPPLKIGVNISGRQFRDHNLIELVRMVLEETGLPPYLLELEVTESMLIEDAEGVKVILQNLKELGVRLAIDDFGTGYSSLAYLRQFPVDSLKIDRAFITDLHHNEEDRLIVTAIMSLAQSLGMSVIAEGIELEEQRDVLSNFGCDEIQGFLIARPMPVADFTAFLANYHGDIESSQPMGSQSRRYNFNVNDKRSVQKRGIVWKKVMSIDLVSIDREHEDIIGQLNTLFDMIESHAPNESCLAQLEDIIQHTFDHFEHEERIMANIRYPDLERHASKHRDLEEDIKRFKVEFVQHHGERDFYYVYNYLKFWFLQHLMHDDRKIKAYMHGGW